MKTHIRHLLVLLAVVLLLAGCQKGTSSPGSNLDPAEAAHLTFASIQKVDGYPLYTMQYYGNYEEVNAGAQAQLPAAPPAWGCSLFAALGDTQSSVFGRNFDWAYSPAMLVRYHPEDGYASISMVDLAYLVMFQDDFDRLAELPEEQIHSLLLAPSIPFDGMNETGLAIGMAAVPAGNVPADPNRETIGSLEVMREVLDHAATVEEAVAIIEKFNIDFTGGPALHYLIADKTGRSAMVEFSNGEVVVTENDQPWHLMTNFIVDQARENPEAQCERYQAISETLSGTNGILAVDDALGLLSVVSQPHTEYPTQWSVVYDLNRAEANVVMGMEYEEVFRYPVKGEVMP